MSESVCKSNCLTGPAAKPRPQGRQGGCADRKADRVRHAKSWRSLGEGGPVLKLFARSRGLASQPARDDSVH